MKAYTRGKLIFEDKDTKNRNKKAIDEFQRAITIDPTFALAYPKIVFRMQKPFV